MPLNSSPPHGGEDATSRSPSTQVRKNAIRRQEESQYSTPMELPLRRQQWR